MDLETTEQLRARLHEIFGFEPCPEQVKVVATLAIRQKDLILIARTGWGKSMIFQAVPALRGGVCLMLMPLNLLEEEQVSWRIFIKRNAVMLAFRCPFVICLLS